MDEKVCLALTDGPGMQRLVEDLLMLAAGGLLPPARRRSTSALLASIVRGPSRSAGPAHHGPRARTASRDQEVATPSRTVTNAVHASGGDRGHQTLEDGDL
jgi:hypothetical protein